jgi:hypothetical protein
MLVRAIRNAKGAIPVRPHVSGVHASQLETKQIIVPASAVTRMPRAIKKAVRERHFNGNTNAKGVSCARGILLRLMVAITWRTPIGWRVWQASKESIPG